MSLEENKENQEKNEENINNEDDEQDEKGEKEQFGELLKYTGAGFASGMFIAYILDVLGFSTSGIGQWLVRTLSGEGESIFEGIYAFKKRLKSAASSMAEAYGWGKLIGMVFPWIIDIISRLNGIDIYGIESFYIPYFYAQSDQIGANISGFVFLYRKERSFKKAFINYFKHPVMIASLIVVLFVPIGLFVARSMGFSPTTQVYTALETIAANLCWIPPLVGWMSQKKDRETKE